MNGFNKKLSEEDIAKMRSAFKGYTINSGRTMKKENTQPVKKTTIRPDNALDLTKTYVTTLGFAVTKLEMTETNIYGLVEGDDFLRTWDLTGNHTVFGSKRNPEFNLITKEEFYKIHRKSLVPEEK
jgi:hypothetical protein